MPTSGLPPSTRTVLHTGQRTCWPARPSFTLNALPHGQINGTSITRTPEGDRQQPKEMRGAWGFSDPEVDSPKWLMDTEDPGSASGLGVCTHSRTLLP